MERLDSMGVESFFNLGGNGAIQSTALAKMGSSLIDVSFYGVWFSRVVDILKKRNVEAWREISRLRKLLPPDKENFPVSLIMEYHGERFIVAHGQGRRMKDIMNIIKGLDRQEAYVISLGGFHAILASIANGPITKDANKFLRTTESILKSIRKKSHLIIDGGSFSAYSKEVLINMFERIYSHAEILSLNKTELSEICNALDINVMRGPGLKDEIEMAVQLMKRGEMDAVWIHGADYSFAVRRKKTISLRTPMIIASAAGAWRVYATRPPTMEELKKVLNEWPLKQEPVPPKISDFDIEAVPSFLPPVVNATVGAGDTATAGFVLGLSIMD